MGIKIKVNRYFLRGRADEWAAAEVSGHTVGQCLDQLIKQSPHLEDELLDKEGKLFHWVGIFVDGEEAFPEGLAMPVKDGDEIHLIPLMGGG